MANEYKMSFLLGAALGGDFKSTFSSASKELTDAQKKIAELNSVAGDVRSYQKQQQAFEETQRKLHLLDVKYETNQKNIQRTGDETGKYTVKQVELEQAMDKANAEYTQQEAELARLKSRLEAAGVDTSKLGDEQKRLAEEIKKTAGESQKYGEKGASAFEAVGDAIAAAGIAAALSQIADAYKECVSMAADFEETMSTVEALSGASAEDVEKLSTLAKDLGATTKFTAKESAEAMTYMAMAGWDAEQMMAGMDGVLQLAAASGEDLATTSDIVTDNLTAFGLTAADTAHFSDVLAAAATNSNTSVSVMGETFKSSAALAGALGYSVDDVAVAIGLMANAGIKGSNAGTALKNVFNGLLEGVTLTSDAFGEVEYSAMNSDGTMKSFAQTLNELRGYFSQMTGAEQMANAETLAGQRAMAGFVSVMNASEDDFNKLSSAISNSAGSAKKMADIKLDNLNGQVTLLNSAADALKTTVGSAFNKELTSLAKIGTEILGDINEFLTQHPVLLKSMIAITGEALLIVGAYKTFNAVKKVGTTLSKLSAALSFAEAAAKTTEAGATAGAAGAQKELNAAMASNPIGLILTGLAALTVALISFANEAEKAANEYKKYTTELEEFKDAMSSADEVYEETEAHTLAAADMADSYIDRLEELEAQGLDTASAQAEYSQTVEWLNELIPELNVEIDEQTGLIKGGTDALRANAQAWKDNALEQAFLKRNKDLIAEYGDALVELRENEYALSAEESRAAGITEKLRAAEAKKAEAEKKYNEITEKYGFSTEAYANGLEEAESALIDANLEIVEYNNELKESKNTQENLKKAIEEGTAVVEENEAAVEQAKAVELEYAEAQNEVNNIQQSTETVVSNVTTKVEELMKAYNDAKDAALKSVQGQYEVWDQAETVAVTSAAKVISNLEGQQKYWDNYNTNLEVLAAKSGEIEGLGEMIASFADGSPESVNMIAGMAAASDEQLGKMVKDWTAVKTAQEEVAGSIADFKVDLEGKLDEIEADVTTTIENLDLSETAKAAAERTVSAYIDAIKGGVPDLKVAADALRDTVGAAMNGTSYGFVAHDRFGHYASGTDSAAPGIALVGEEGPEIVAFGGGEKVLNAETTAGIIGGHTTITVAPQITLQGSATEEDANRVAQAVAQMVIETLNERDADERRARYA